MTSNTSRLSSETRQAMINVTLAGGVACALTWSLMAAVSAGEARDMIESATAEPVASELAAETSELGGMVDPANIMAALSTPCVMEDDVNCYWIASAMGNGEGESFVNIEGHIFPLASVLSGGAS